MDLAEVRRQNALNIMQENALDELSFALCLGVDEDKMAAMLHFSTKKKISDGLARTIEQTFSKPAMWLDGDFSGGDDGHSASGPSYDLFG